MAKRIWSTWKAPANESRLFIICASLAIFIGHLIRGTGFGTFPLVYPAFRLKGDPNELPMPSAHSMIMSTAAEGAAVGFAAFPGIVLTVIYGGWRWHRAAPPAQEQTIAAVSLSPLVGAIVHQFFDGTLLSVHLGLGLWILLAILSVGWIRVSAAASHPWTSA